MEHIDFVLAYREKARLELHKNVTRYTEQILEVTSHKTAAVRTLTSYFYNNQNKSNKTCRTLLEKSGRTHNRRSPMDLFTGICRWLSEKQELIYNRSVWTQNVDLKTCQKEQKIETNGES